MSSLGGRVVRGNNSRIRRRLRCLSLVRLFVYMGEFLWDFLHRNIKRIYFRYLAAVFGSALISSVYSIVDMAMAGSIRERMVQLLLRWSLRPGTLFKVLDCNARYRVFGCGLCRDPDEACHGCTPGKRRGRRMSEIMKRIYNVMPIISGICFGSAGIFVCELSENMSSLHLPDVF